MHAPKAPSSPSHFCSPYAPSYPHQLSRSLPLPSALFLSYVPPTFSLSYSPSSPLAYSGSISLTFSLSLSLSLFFSLSISYSLSFPIAYSPSISLTFSLSSLSIEVPALPHCPYACIDPSTASTELVSIM
jgi:hypothetical protein